MQYLGAFFSSILGLCNKLTGNHWWAIVLFTCLSKILLLPIAVTVQKNSIKMVKMYPEMNRIKARYFGNRDMISEKQYELYKREAYHPMFDLIPVAIQLLLLLGVSAAFPHSSEQSPVYMPVLAALSALVLCLVQNKSNVLQSEQSKANKWGTLVFSVALSLYLGIFVSKEVAFYWICSNLMAVAQLYILNCIINPRKYIDYISLDESRRELAKIKSQSVSRKTQKSRELIQREKTDFKRFLRFENKQVVFYSEKKGFYKYFQDIIELILKKTDIIIHYISSDPNDEIFDYENEFFRTYYIDEKLMVLMMRMEADMVVMTMPDLQNYYIKRSMVKDDIEYVYIPHGVGSNNLLLRSGSLDHFDTIFVTNQSNYDECRTNEAIHHLPEKTLVPFGYPLIDRMIASYSPPKEMRSAAPVILIAPSWQESNILDLCIDDILCSLLPCNYEIVLRPHPQYVRHFPERLDALDSRYKDSLNFHIVRDFSSNSMVFDADVLITDWSSICYEYSFSTLKPCLFIDTPMKIMNPGYLELGIEPFDLTVRKQIGVSLSPTDCAQTAEKISQLLSNSEFSPDSISEIRSRYLYNIGNSANIGAKYIINRLVEKSKL